MQMHLSTQWPCITSVYSEKYIVPKKKQVFAFYHQQILTEIVDIRITWSLTNYENIFNFQLIFINRNSINRKKLWIKEYVQYDSCPHVVLM